MQQSALDDDEFIDAELPPLERTRRDTTYVRQTRAEYNDTRRKLAAARNANAVDIGKNETDRTILSGRRVHIKQVDVGPDVYAELKRVAADKACSVQTVVNDFIVRGLALYTAHPELIRPNLRAKKMPRTPLVDKLSTAHTPIQHAPKRPTLGEE